MLCNSYVDRQTYDNGRRRIASLMSGLAIGSNTN